MSIRAALGFIALLCGVASALFAQETSMIQIKVFDQQLNAVSNLGISINEGDYIPLKDKKATFYDVPKTDLPPTTIKLSRPEWEVESWNFSKGTLEIIIRKKAYQIVRVMIQTLDRKPLAGTLIQFHGRREIALTTDASGVVNLPVALDEEINSQGQFTVAGYRVSRLITAGNAKILLVEAQQKKSGAPAPSVTPSFDVTNLDSLKSLTLFYSMLKDQNMSALDARTKARIDERFRELVNELQQTRDSRTTFMSRISDSSFVKNDVENLLEQARLENALMDDFRRDFDDKIQVINRKLSGGTSSLSVRERENLFQDLTALEEVLRQNEDKFYRNVADYRIMLRSLKASFSDIKDLQEQLSASELKRLEEQREFKNKILLAVITVTLFGALLIWSMLLRSRVASQKKRLVKANAEIQHVNENLEVLVFERSRQLVEAYKEMDIFLYRASHDLRAPICTIIGLCNLMLHQAQGDEELVNKISSTALKMDGLLKKLKMISEVNQPSNYSPVTLSNIIGNVNSVFSRAIADHKIEVIVEDDATTHFYSYPDLIEIILYNLVENALFFSTLATGRRPRIQIMASVEDNTLFISVYDNGVGMDDETRVKLWNMFFVGHERSKGNGLGLYIVLKSVQSLNGKIDVESVAGAYTRFSVMLPINTKVTGAINRLGPAERELRIATV